MEELHEASPYTTESLPAAALGIDSPATVRVDRWTAPGAADTDAAAQHFATYGAVLVGPEFYLAGSDQTVGEAVRPVVTATVETLGVYVDDPDVVRPKVYTAYNGTERRMRTVSYPNVIEYFDPVMALQHDLLPTVRAIARDESVEVSVDPDEGTVINLQLFNVTSTDPTERQQHGAHTDRVDTTVVVCLDNVGPNGDLVFAHGYTEACQRLGLNEHVDFNTNLRTILAHDPTTITFRVHPVQPGGLVMIKSAEDVHFITPKTRADVDAGIEAGRRPIALGETLMVGRTIVNMAFETGECRAIDAVARSVEEIMAADELSGASFYDRLHAAIARLEDVPAAWHRAIIGAVVARGSAADLYGKDTPSGTVI
ncbi:MAG TPA: hypothetical protein VLE99_02580 [Candidatus Saccharimonadales bacterium]|nr:hypothetical protein [Candidatus Saccharimonadales bacterium]